MSDQDAGTVPDNCPALYALVVFLGQVIGTCVATRKAEGLEGVKLLLVQPLDKDKKPKGSVIVAADTVQAGPGEFVYLVGAREAAQALEPAFVPVDAAVVGIIDDLHHPGPASSTKKARS